MSLQTYLPAEVVSHIMKFLSVSDRKEAALVNKTWYEASLDPVLQHDIVISFTTATTGYSVSSLKKRKMPHLLLTHLDSSLGAKSLVLKSCEIAQNLQSLSLRCSNITEGTFLEILSHCKVLKSLDLSCCDSLFMSGKLLEKKDDNINLKDILKEVKELKLNSLRFLSDATFNRLVAVCPNIEKLSLASIQMTFNSTPYYPKGTETCDNGSMLTFQNILQYINSHSSQLVSFDFSKTTMSNESLVKLGQTKNLRLSELILNGCKEIADKGIARLCKSQPHLKSIDLSGCIDVGDGCIASITSHLTELESLKLNKCRGISDTSVKMLKYLGKLEFLDLSECYQVTSQGLISGICSQKDLCLSHLNLNCCSLIQGDFILGLSKVAPNLTHLDIGSCFHLTDLSVHLLSKYMMSLRFLRLAWCKEITDLGLLGFEREGNPQDTHHEQGEHGNCRCTRRYNSNTIFKKPSTGLQDHKLSVSEIEDMLKVTQDRYKISNISGLRHLDISACPKLTDIGIKETIRFKELRSLSLNMVHGITDSSIISVATHNPSLEELSLSHCTLVTDDGISIAASRLKRLTSLDISSCDRLTDRSIHVLQDKCKRLKHLNVSFCGSISLQAVEKLETDCDTLLSVQKRLVGGN
ncbi:hypothetical protein ScPMuIL_000208 [Solemya velum]